MMRLVAALGEGRGEEVLVGLVAAVVALLVVRRIVLALKEGEIALYRTRIRRREAGDAKFFTLVAVNAGAVALLLFIAIDLLGDMGWR
ncbi:hypothetical protein [Sphingomicrobium arenosum]|uniref:hypothetical protein n=1 Tax=Sphingomicrobium arenosum TaxID=2233861 RepID=UPI002240EE60|nr:hypothetical protein [Sphingomicrobium arenosum]